MSKDKPSELPKVIYTNLGRSRPKLEKNGLSKTSFGTWDKGVLKIDPRQEPKEMLDTIVHEILHEGLPELNEEGVERVSNLISEVLWREGYRKTQL